MLETGHITVSGEPGSSAYNIIMTPSLAYALMFMKYLQVSNLKASLVAESIPENFAKFLTT